jgi:glycosyltransferase involved in cell wall biosynthesis
VRILQLAQFYPPLIGGEENHVRNLGIALAERGHQVAVATQAVEGLPDVAEDAGVEVHRLRSTTQRIGWLYANPQRRLAPPLPDPGFARGLRRVVDRFQPDVVHAHNWAVYSYLPLHRGRRGLVLSLHDYSSVCAKKTLIWGASEPCPGPSISRCPACAIDHYGVAKGLMTVTGLSMADRFLTRAVDTFLPVSSAVADGNRLSERHLSFQVIPNFVPDALLEDDAPAPAPYAEQLPSEPFILYVGAFARRKGIHVLLDAYRSLPDGPPLVLIGYDTSEAVPELVTPPPGVDVHRNWPHDAVMAAWRRALVGVVPSTWADPCPTVAIEAMAAGRPLIASCIGGLTDLVQDGENGLLSTPGDHRVLADALKTLLNDPLLAARMGEAGRDRARRFTASAVVDQIAGVYGTAASRTQ